MQRVARGDARGDDRRRVDVGDHDRAEPARRQRQRGGRLIEPHVRGRRLVDEADAGDLRVAFITGAVAGGRRDRARQVPEQLLGVAGVVEETAAVDRVAEQLDLPGAGRALQILGTGEADAREERRGEDRRVEGPAGRPAEVLVVGDAERERQIDRRVVGAGVADIVVTGEGGEQAADLVPAGRQRHAEGGVVLGLELRRRLHQDRLHVGPRRGVVGGVGRRDVVERVDVVDDVLVARREVPAHAAGFDQDAQRVRAAGVLGGVAFPAEPPDVALGRIHAALEKRIVECSRGVAGRDLGRSRPVGHILGVLGVVDRLDFLAVLRGALRIEEEGAGGVATPRVARLGPADHARELQAGIEVVLVGRALGPVAAADGRRVRRVDADLTRRRQTAIDAVDGQGAETPREEAKAPSARTRLGLCRGGRRRQRRQCQGKEARQHYASLTKK